jgi:hypothetical protein
MSACRTTSGSLAAVAEWRRSRLVDAGFGPELAGALAQDVVVDLHAVLLLVDRGCPPALAARILAPVEDWARCPL